SNSSGVKLQGQDASFTGPLYLKWFKESKASHPDVKVDYQSTGSGQGVTSMIDGTVDFGASDAAMTPAEVAKVGRGVVMLPMTAGEIVLAFNLEGMKDLKLSREAYIGIFLNKITKWNDPAIVKNNPMAQLPDKEINVIVRSDSSGTSFVFTKHLSAISEEFNKSPGTSKSPNWPTRFTNSTDNKGAAASLKSTPNSIGYVEYGYAKNTGLAMATLENKEGAFIVPSTASGQAALAAATLPEDLVVWLPDP